MSSVAQTLFIWMDLALKGVAMMRVKAHQRRVCKAVKSKDADLSFCYEKLQKVSRSFAGVIMALNDQVRDAICIFYLVLRGLDTIEDDMSVPLDVKVPELLAFYEKLDQPGWKIDGIGEADERELLENFDAVIRSYAKLPAHLQEPIADICRKMGEGMAKSVQREASEVVQTIEEYEMYCHYVAGLVGHGLSRIFAASGLENPSIGTELDVANSMGLFLQKVNIIRDYLEDIVEEPPRMFWPKEIWGKFSDDFHAFKKPEHREQAVKCLNAMVNDALKHIPDCMTYMSKLKDPSVFQFCAIPQVMAIATLAKLYNNEQVFMGVVKISKGLACQLMMDCGNMCSLLKQFHRFMTDLLTSAQQVEPDAKIITKLQELLECNAALQKSEKEKLNALRASNSSLSFFLLTYCAGIVASAIQGLKASIFPAVEIPAAKPVVAEAAACQ
jgi:farnesyl-diphosphate farnesyltransferase|eukprot:CAMPEP_0174282520 /NCGR_PEP_ID=MMETSP0809-20121228/3042_1 /TAXON_ID=73025 ORGANISM="Eutreptiella gymnastica-like, Strain CCMP1594" /NCGR_SAMPLE_ID=MMETSP0809 /ASSEMBLY_ACC=CAM_ASM_000658 /LENGTH=442 /DNA_ID=CAMNT_0015376795 /DNA_START=38 /DNA_END=1366 /DNA_ORIENTATION=-